LIAPDELEGYLTKISKSLVELKGALALVRENLKKPADYKLYSLQERRQEEEKKSQ